MLVSIIIITFNRKKILKRCINSLLTQTYQGKKELIIIDDGSTDGTKNQIIKLQKKYKNIKYFFQENKGFASARNLGLKKAKGDIIAFTDDDCVPKEDWLERIVQKHKEYPGCAAIGGAILNPLNSNLAWANHILNFSSWYPLGKTRFVKDIPTTNISYKKKFIKNMYFDESLGRLNYEESLFNFNLIKKKHKILFEPAIQVEHYREIKGYQEFLNLQQRYGKAFLKQGYIVHGFTGKILIKFKFINLICPRLILILFRNSRSLDYVLKFFETLPFIIRGEFERGLTIMTYKKL